MGGFSVVVLMGILSFIVTIILIALVIGGSLGFLVNKSLEDFHNKDKKKKSEKRDNNNNIIK